MYLEGHLRWLVGWVAAIWCFPSIAHAWDVEYREIQAADSVRIRAESSLANIEWGSGDADNPVSLRGVEYMYATKKPYEWILKFNLVAYRGKTLSMAKIRLAKCEASSTCKTRCASAGTCTCGTIMWDVKASCGGGNIDEGYEASSDDLHAWLLPNDWDSLWSMEEWIQSWDGATRAGVEECCQHGQGGSKAFSGSQVRYAGGVSVVGQAGIAEIDVTTSLFSVDPTSDEKQGIRYKVAEDAEYVSFRLTVNGTKSRFFVPANGDADYVPVLKMGVMFTTTTTTTTGNSSMLVFGGFLESTETTTSISASPNTTTTSTTSVTSTSTTTSGPATGPGDNETTTTSLPSHFDLEAVHELEVLLTKAIDVAEFEAQVNSQGFQDNVVSAVAFALGISEQDVIDLHILHQQVRRLSGGNATTQGDRVTVGYKLQGSSLAELDRLSMSLTNAPFSTHNTFSQQLQLRESARTGGLSIERVEMRKVRTQSNVGNQSVNETLIGHTLQVFGAPGWDRARVESWSTSAMPAVEAAVLASLPSPYPSAQQVFHVKLGPISMESSKISVKYDIWVTVPHFNTSLETPLAYEARYLMYNSAVESLSGNSSSADFFNKLSSELAQIGVPLLPEMTFLPGQTFTISSSTTTAAGVSNAAMILIASVVGLLFCGVAAKVFYLDSFQSCRARLCPCCPDKKQEASEDDEESAKDEESSKDIASPRSNSSMKSARNWKNDLPAGLSFLSLVGNGVQDALDFMHHDITEVREAREMGVNVRKHPRLSHTDVVERLSPSVQGGQRHIYGIDPSYAAPENMEEEKLEKEADKQMNAMGISKEILGSTSATGAIPFSAGTGMSWMTAFSGNSTQKGLTPYPLGMALGISKHPFSPSRDPSVDEWVIENVEEDP